MVKQKEIHKEKVCVDCGHQLADTAVKKVMSSEVMPASVEDPRDEVSQCSHNDGARSTSLPHRNVLQVHC